MKTYDEMVRDYTKKKKDTLIDTIGAGLTYADDLCVETGLLEETGLLREISEGACGALPFVMIAAIEGGKVILKRKPGITALKDGSARMMKTGLAMGVGAAVLAAGAPLWAGIPATLAVRSLVDRYRSGLMTGHRVQGRINRLQELRLDLEKQQTAETAPAAEPLPESRITVLTPEGEEAI